VRRREFITLLGGAATAWPLAARAQQPAMPMIGVLRPNPRDVNEVFAEPFRRYMKATGWEEGRDDRTVAVALIDLAESGPRGGAKLEAQASGAGGRINRINATRSPSPGWVVVHNYLSNPTVQTLAFQPQHPID
jgi:hypothetical protein